MAFFVPISASLALKYLVTEESQKRTWDDVTLSIIDLIILSPVLVSFP